VKYKRKKSLGIPKGKALFLQTMPIFLLYTLSIIFWELLLHVALFRQIGARFLYVVGFSVFFGLLLTLLTGFFKRKGNIAVMWVLLSLLYLWYACQLIYFQIFGGFISVYLVGMGGEAVTNFFKETVNCVLQNLWLLAIMALPFAAAGISLRRRWINPERQHWISLAGCAVGCVIVHLLCLWSLTFGGTGAYSIYDVYHNVNTGTDISAQNLGILTTLRLETKFLIFGTGDKGGSGVGDLTIMDPDNLGDILGTPETPSVPGGDVVEYHDQTMQIDFDALIAQAEANGDSAMATLHKYFQTQAPTKTNDFTGLFEGKNLIYMVCESFSPVVISQELTPTLYKLANEGIKFNNFYGTYRNVTTNGEYTACMGIFPDLSRKKQDGSFENSANNYLPFTLGNIFQSQLGVSSYGYHNYVGSYYERRNSHPNMGYACKFMNKGLKFTTSWPSSDYEMMQQSVQDYINEDQFHAYYMTFSGHYVYDFEINPMCKRNKDAVAHLEYSEAVKAYIACHLELEKAMTYLMEELEKAGKLNDTVIVMTTDHYPYGLTTKQYSELAGEKKDGSFGIYENAFICWAGGMEEPIEVDTPCCTVDILPTLLNLFGLEYDSRLLIGKDVLDPTTPHIAILHNGSFITDKVMFNSSNGKVIYLVEESQVSDQYVPTINQIIQDRFTVSTAILNNDYYRVVFSPGEGS